jgi:mannose-6-phosphate isomerase-like protein (cupin superfamily)
MKMAKIKKKINEEHAKVNRAWGFEIWIINSEKYCGKVLYIKKGMKTSLQYHLEKTETMWLEAGRVNIRLLDPETAEEYVEELVPGESIHLKPGQVHQIVALEDSFIHEFSTQHFEFDTYRVEPNNK